MELGSYFLFLQEQINDIIIIGERRDQVRFNAAAERARIKPAVRAAVGRQF
jgi:hypothetical protein